MMDHTAAIPDLYRRLGEFIVAGKECALAAVVSCEGPVPREAGALMLVTSEGPASGTVGGGILESQVIERALGVIESGRPLFETFSLEDGMAAERGMICGGTIQVLIDRVVPAAPENLSIWRKALESLGRRESCWLVISLCSGADGLRTGAGILSGREVDAGSLPLPAGAMHALISSADRNEPALVGEGDERYFVLPLQIPGRVFIFGAGHVSRALVPLCRKVGFFPVVVDDREGFADARFFPDAGKVLPVDSFAGSVAELDIDGESFVVVATRGHRHDLEVVGQALETEARYVGMIGSRRKKNSILSALRLQGVSGEDLRRIRTPVGLSIGARTPEEIAVSIVAEMIAVRSGVAE